jgi:hypothetical protein
LWRSKSAAAIETDDPGMNRRVVSDVAVNGAKLSDHAAASDKVHPDQKSNV